jgi:hypothetical protein
MTKVCNRVAARGQVFKSEEEKALYLDSEHYIEAGSAYFVRAFAEVLGMTSDLELHNLEGAELRLRSTASLLEHALRQYETAVESGAKSGVNQYHDRKLREAGLDSKGASQVLSEAVSRGFLMDNDERIETFATDFDRMGCSGLMSLFIKGVWEIHNLVVTMSESETPERDVVAWQELSWKLMTLFTQALEIGKAIAVLNIFTFRYPLGALASDANWGKPVKLNS